jgi:hypothetical protein
MSFGASERAQVTEQVGVFRPQAAFVDFPRKVSGAAASSGGCCARSSAGVLRRLGSGRRLTMSVSRPEGSFYAITRRRRAAKGRERLGAGIREF